MTSTRSQSGPGGRSISDPRVAHAVGVLRRGGLVAFPTETVYGLGADASSPAAVARLFAAKGRPLTHPVIVHLGDTELLETWARQIPPAAHRLAASFWPGPLTLVLPRQPHVDDAVTGGLETVGLRVPDQALALELLRAFGGGVAAPSANRFGRISPTTAADVRFELGDAVDDVLDGGPCRVGVESTIVEVLDDAVTVLRHGAVTLDAVEEVVGHAVGNGSSGPARAPGMLATHYAPAARVELVDEVSVTSRATLLDGQGVSVGVLAGARIPDLPPSVVVLDPAGDAEDYGRNLYARLRDADHRGLEVLLVVPPPERGIGVAVVDRLRRAAASGLDRAGDLRTVRGA